jgi:predicted short-subunit dehydrogenase-like oxidoreductase (DUF2520 family)
MGGALALALVRRKYPVSAIVSLSKKSARKLAGEISSAPPALGISQLNSLPLPEVILITTPDSEIAAAGEKLANIKTVKINKPVVLHTSGSLSSEILLPLKEIGCAVGSMHPLASISEPRAGIKRFANSYFCVEGDPKARQAANEIVRDLGGRSFSLETKYKPLYHAAAVMTSGHTTALFSTAVDILTGCGLSAEKAKAVLLPLLTGTAQNLKKQTPAQALTGTFARADVGAFERHIKLLAENADADSIEIYLLLGKISLKLAEEQGADKNRIKILRRKIQRKLK